MNCARNIITANFSGGTSATTAPLWQWDYGQVLCITGIEDLPAAFEVHFSTNRTGGVSTTAVGADGQVTIPNVLLTIGKNLNAWIYLSDAQGEGETEYSITIPVKSRPMPETYDAEVSGEFDDVVRQVSEYSQTAQTAADNAGASASAAATSASEAAASASAAETAKTAAETAQGKAEDAQTAAESAAQTATEKAQQTAQDAAQAAQSKTDAESAAQRAEAAETGSESAKTDAETAAQGAAASASAASASASSAGQAATSAGQSATAAAESATTAENAAQTATTKAGEASASATAANTAKTAAQTAQTGAETAATNAGQSASTATAKAAEAAQSASNAAASETAAEAAATRAETAAASLTVDDALSDVSENPVQNKVVTGEFAQVKSAISDIVDSAENLNAIYTVTGYYIDRNGIVSSSSNFETVKFAIPSGCNQIKVKTRTYGPGKIIITNTDATSENFASTRFTLNTTFYPDANPTSLTTIEATLDVNGQGFVYVPHYVNDSTVGVHVEAVISGRLSTVENDVDALTSDVDKMKDSVSALQMNPSWTADKYINTINGAVNPFTPTTILAYCCTNKLRCDIFESVTFKQYYSGVAGSAFYDVNGDFMQGVPLSGNLNDEITLPIPSGAYYFATTYRYNPSATIPSYPTLTATVTTKSLKQGAFTDEQEVALQKMLDGMTDSPLSKIIHDGGYTALFHKIGCIGDSLASGEMYYTDAGGNLHGIDMYEFSWGQCMAREIGITAYNFSVGGLTAKTWYDMYADTADFTTNNICMAYIIGLGVNDVAYAPYGVGTSADINLSDKTQNADSFYGHYGKIIQRIKEVQPKAKIFCITLPRVTTNNTPYSDAIRDMAEIFDNVYIIDLAEYASDIYLNLPSAMWFGGHMTALGYQMASWHIGTYIDWIVRNNMDEFNQVQFIGTNYEQ